MNAFAIATELLGNISLTPDQLAGLRALDRKYAQRVYSLLHASNAARQKLTDAEAADLRTLLVSDILALLTPEQQSLLQR